MKLTSFLRLFFVILLFGLSAQKSAAQKQQLNLWKRDGQKVCYDMASNPKVTIVGNELVITANNVSFRYALQTIQRYTYSEVTEGLDSVTSKSLFFSFHGEHLLISGITPGQLVTVYSEDGKLLAEATANTDYSASIPLLRYGKGNYIVNVGHYSYKIQK